MCLKCPPRPLMLCVSPLLCCRHCSPLYTAYIHPKLRAARNFPMRPCVRLLSLSLCLLSGLSHLLACLLTVTCVDSTLPTLTALLELALHGNPCTEGFYPSMESDTAWELVRPGPPRLFVGGVRMNAQGKLETRGAESEDSVSLATAALPDLPTYTMQHPPPAHVCTLVVVHVMLLQASFAPHR